MTKEERKAQNIALKIYLRGKLFWNSKLKGQYIKPKKENK